MSFIIIGKSVQVRVNIGKSVQVRGNNKCLDTIFKGHFATNICESFKSAED